MYIVYPGLETWYLTSALDFSLNKSEGYSFRSTYQANSFIRLLNKATLQAMFDKTTKEHYDLAVLSAEGEQIIRFHDVLATVDRQPIEPNYIVVLELGDYKFYAGDQRFLETQNRAIVFNTICEGLKYFHDNRQRLLKLAHTRLVSQVEFLIKLVEVSDGKLCADVAFDFLHINEIKG